MLAVFLVSLANNGLVQSGHDWVIGAVPVADNGSQRGVPNPFGAGASAFEPNTIVYDPSNDPLMAGSEQQLTGKSRTQELADQAAADAAKTPAATPAANAGDASSPAAGGSALAVINAAKQLLGKPYVWGGTTISGTDCSGLLYYAFNKAGIKMPRYRAVDYGKMGQQVTADAALPGDIVYWNEPGDVDHVGIYLGNGMVLNSPHTGTTTQINRVWGNPTYRRIIQDGNFGHMATSDGGTVLAYDGMNAAQLFSTDTAGAPAGNQWSASAAMNLLNPTNAYKVRAE